MSTRQPHERVNGELYFIPTEIAWMWTLCKNKKTLTLGLIGKETWGIEKGFLKYKTKRTNSKGCIGKLDYIKI